MVGQESDETPDMGGAADTPPSDLGGSVGAATPNMGGSMFNNGDLPPGFGAVVTPPAPGDVEEEFPSSPTDVVANNYVVPEEEQHPNQGSQVLGVLPRPTATNNNTDNNNRDNNGRDYDRRRDNNSPVHNNNNATPPRRT